MTIEKRVAIGVEVKAEVLEENPTLEVEDLLSRDVLVQDTKKLQGVDRAHTETSDLGLDLDLDRGGDPTRGVKLHRKKTYHPVLIDLRHDTHAHYHLIRRPHHLHLYQDHLQLALTPVALLPALKHLANLEGEVTHLVFEIDDVSQGTILTNHNQSLFIFPNFVSYLSVEDDFFARPYFYFVFSGKHFKHSVIIYPAFETLLKIFLPLNVSLQFQCEEEAHSLP